jgi:sugar phosphate isomerase/epimerase
LRKAVEVGAQGIQLYATGGDTHPDVLKGAARDALRREVEGLGLEIAAVCGDFGGHGFQVSEENAKRVDDSKRVVDLALELGSRVITTHIGVVPADAKHPRYTVMARACEQLGRYAADVGACFAIETGPEPAAVLRAFLDDIGIPEGMGVNFDPANLVMVCQENIPEAVRTLAPYIRHTHAKDGVNKKPVTAEMLYASFVEPIDNFNALEYIEEVPLGCGQVDFPTYLDALRAVGFDGYLTIEREVGENPYDDIRQAVDFLAGLIG